MQGEFGIRRYTLLWTGWINNEGTIFNILHKPYRKERERTCEYITEPLCCTAEINTVNQLYFN